SPQRVDVVGCGRSIRSDALGGKMRRRDFLAAIGGAAAGPIAAGAQQLAWPVIGMLGSQLPNRFQAFQQALREGGFVEGQNVRIEHRRPDVAQLSAFAAELVGQQVSVILASPTVSALAAKQATSKIPIVFVIGGDPVGFGLVESMNRPGGNVTGVSFLVNN